MTPAPLPPDYFGFENLPALQAAHTRLVRQQAGSPAPADFLESVEAFVIKAQATGRVLEDDDARTSAQTIIDYWVTVLLRGRRTPPETGLAEFGFHAMTASIRDRPAAEFLTEERVAIRKRLRLSAAAAQWNDSARDRPLLWGGGELEDAAKYPDLSDVEKEFVAESIANEKRVAKVRQRVFTAAWVAAGLILTLVIGGLAWRARVERQHAREAAEDQVNARHKLAKNFVEHAEWRMSEGDFAGSVASLVQALKEDSLAKSVGEKAKLQNPKADNSILQADRLRLGAAFAQHPILDQFFIEKDALYMASLAKFSPDGKCVLTVANRREDDKPAQTAGVARLFDVGTGAELAHFSEKESGITDAGFWGDKHVVTFVGSRVLLWPRDGGEPAPLPGTQGNVKSVALSSDGKRLALLREDAAGIEVHAAGGGNPVTIPWDAAVRQIVFSPDSTRIAVCGAAKAKTAGAGDAQKSLQEQFRVFDATTGTPVERQTAAYSQPVSSIDFSPDNRRVVVVTTDAGAKQSRVEVRDAAAEAGAQVPVAVLSGEDVVAKFSPDSQHVLVFVPSNAETARVLDARTCRTLLEFKHESSLSSAAYSPDGRFIATGSRDKTACVWSVATGKLTLPALNHGSTVRNVSFSPDGRCLLTVAADGVRMWLLRTGEIVAPVVHLSEPIWKMGIDDEGRRVVAMSRKGTVGRWDLQSQDAPVLASMTGGASAKAVFFSGDAKFALVAMRGTVRVWDTEKSAWCAPATPVSPWKELSYAVFDRANARVLIVSGRRGDAECSARILDVASGKQVGKVLAADGVVTFATFSSDGAHLLTASGTVQPIYGEARVWNAETGDPQTPPLRHREEVLHASFDSGLTRVATASADDTGKIWDIDLKAGTARERCVLKEHTADLTLAVFSPEGKHVVTASKDSTAILWDADTGKRLRVLRHPGVIHAVNFDPTGRYLVTACTDQAARIWTVPGGEWISLFRHEGKVTRVLFTPAEKRGALNLVTLSSYEPSELQREVRRSVLGAGANAPGGTEPAPAALHRARVWHLAESEGTDEELQHCSQLILPRSMDASGDFVRLSRQALLDIWNERKDVVEKTKSERNGLPEMNAFEESEATGEWFAARWHLTRLLLDKPADPALLGRRGDASARLREWEKAAADYEAALGSKPDREFSKRLTQARIELRQFDKAVEQASLGIQNAADDVTLHMARAEAYAAWKNWDAAAADLEKAAELNPKNPSILQRLAGVRVKQGRHDDYIALAKKLVERFGHDEGYASIVAWACALQPDSGNAPEDIVKLARFGLTDDPDSFYSLNTLGAALYRAGHFQEAIDQIAISRRAYTQAASAAELRGDTDAAWLMPQQDGRPSDWLFLAMANHQLGNATEAKVWLGKAQTALASENIRDPRRMWSRIELELLMDEATRLLADKDKASP